MTPLPPELRELIEAGPLAHVTTINPDGSPQVTVVWIGLDGDDVISAHMRKNKKLQNMERDPRVVISFDAPRDTSEFLQPYAVLRTRATVEASDKAWDWLNRFTKIYMDGDQEFPAPPGPGFIARYKVERISGVGPWVPR